jgi:hypothetical protein
VRPTIDVVRDGGDPYVHSFYLRNLSGVTGEGQGDTRSPWPEWLPSVAEGVRRESAGRRHI